MDLGRPIGAADPAILPVFWFVVATAATYRALLTLISTYRLIIRVIMLMRTEGASTVWSNLVLQSEYGYTRPG